MLLAFKLYNDIITFIKHFLLVVTIPASVSVPFLFFHEFYLPKIMCVALIRLLWQFRWICFAFSRIWHQIYLNCCGHLPTITAISWSPPWISYFFTKSFLRAAHFFLQLGWFGLDFTSFCNCILCITSILPSLLDVIYLFLSL